MNKGQMELSYEEIQMELDLRGSELNMKRTHYIVLEAYGMEYEACTLHCAGDVWVRSQRYT